jgi:hypothetical protein
MNLAHHPKLRQLARNLHIPESGDSLRELSEHAIASVQKMIAEWNGIETIEELRFLVADRLSVKLEFLRTDEDVDRIAGEYRHFLTRFRRLLHADFLQGTTEGLLIDNPEPHKGGRRYLAIIDARGSRSARAYFTAWHELAHLLLCPPQQLLLEGFRRTPIAVTKLKDPLESAVDQIAGLLAFWSPIFGPALQEDVGAQLTFAGIERAAANVAPGASLYAASLAATRLWLKPAVFLTAEMGTKTNGTGLALRVQTLIPNGGAGTDDCCLHKNMRVPTKSILSRAFADPFGREWEADENQAEWEVSGQGYLPTRAWRVQAVRRGSAVYGILTPEDGSFTANNN